MRIGPSNKKKNRPRGKIAREELEYSVQMVSYLRWMVIGLRIQHVDSKRQELANVTGSAVAENILPPDIPPCLVRYTTCLMWRTSGSSFSTCHMLSRTCTCIVDRTRDVMDSCRSKPRTSVTLAPNRVFGTKACIPRTPFRFRFENTLGCGEE